MKETLRHDLVINKGENYTVDFSYQEDDGTPVDVSGWTAEAQIREFPEAKDYQGFVCSADNTGFHLSLSAENTERLSFSRGFYDVFITDPYGLSRVKLVQGRVSVIRDTTR